MVPSPARFPAVGFSVVVSSCRESLVADARDACSHRTKVHPLMYVYLHICMCLARKSKGGICDLEIMIHHDLRVRGMCPQAAALSSSKAIVFVGQACKS